MSDSDQHAASASEPGALPGAFSLPAPCALVDGSGRVESVNAAWSARAAAVAPVGGNLVQALRGVGGGIEAAEGLGALVAGKRQEFACDLCLGGTGGP